MAHLIFSWRDGRKDEGTENHRDTNMAKRLSFSSYERKGDCAMRKKIFLSSLMVVLSLVAVNAWSGPLAYVTNHDSNNVSVIDTATNTAVGAPIPVGQGPLGVAVNPAGTRVYVTNNDSNNVSVIDTSTNAVIATIPVGSLPWGGQSTRQAHGSMSQTGSAITSPSLMQ